MSEKSPTPKSSLSRPILGIDLGGTKILAGIVDPKGQIIARAKKKTRVDHGSNQVLDRILAVAHEAAGLAGLDVTDLAGCGIGAPGQIDLKTGTIVYAPNLGWREVPLEQRLREGLGIPAFLDNDVNVIAVAEHMWGAAQGVDTFVAVAVGTGIGSGIILRGELWHGFNGTAGEIGHTVIDQDGPKWPLSNRGCLESLASRTAMGKRLAKAMASGAKTVLRRLTDGGKVEEISSGKLAKAAEAGDVLVLSELKFSARILGIALGNVINFLGPQMIVLGGGVMQACGELMLKTIVKNAKATAIANSGDNVQIVLSTLGDDAGILGAAALARRRLGA